MKSEREKAMLQADTDFMTNTANSKSLITNLIPFTASTQRALLFLKNLNTLIR